MTYECPECAYCGNAKTWETTKYIKSYTFYNQSACLDCYMASDDGHEWPYMVRQSSGKPAFRNNLHDVLEFWPYMRNPRLFIRGKEVAIRRSARLAGKPQSRVKVMYYSPHGGRNE